MITIGDRLPEATLTESTEFGEACPLSPKPVNTVEAARGKRIVVFGLPGAYTPTCSAKHVPGYLANLDALKARGVDEIWCVSVNDGYVMAAWGREQHAIGVRQRRTERFAGADAPHLRRPRKLRHVRRGGDDPGAVRAERDIRHLAHVRERTGGKS